MAISNYTELQSAVTDWMARTDVSGSAADFIALGEAQLNRLLEPVATTASLVTVSGSDRINISSLSIIEPIGLYLTDNDEEYFLTQKPNGSFSKEDTSGLPGIYAFEGDYIIFDRDCDQAYPARFVYSARFGLSDAAPTNAFLTENPDMYLAAAITWGSIYVKDDAEALKWNTLWKEFEQQVKNTNAQKKRGVLGVDPGLYSVGRLWYRRLQD